MRSGRMVRLTTVRSTFHARVIAARLGADGIVTELRGNVDGPYPMGDVHVWVEEASLPEATELLLADEVESAFDGVDTAGGSADGGGLVDGVRRHARWFVAAAVLAAAAVAVSRVG